MSSFLVYKRGKYYYARVKNIETGQWTTAKSTRKTDKNEAIYSVMNWMHNSVNADEMRFQRSSVEYFQFDTLFHKIKNASLKPSDAQKIVEYFKSEGLIEGYRAVSMVDVLDERAASLTGHSTKEMLEHYTNHVNELDFGKARVASEAVFSTMAKLIPTWLTMTPCILPDLNP